MNKNKPQQGVRHLRLLKPNRSGREHTKHKIDFDLDSRQNKRKLGSPSDLNIPKELVPYVSKRIQDAGGSLRLLLNQCVYKRPLLVPVQKQNVRDRVGYQKQRLELIRFPFRPFEEDWNELKRLASLYNVSMCRMFVRLLESDLPPNSAYATNFELEVIQTPPQPIINSLKKTGT
ncbi:DUF1564 family protein [Leptospira yasudae]|uniref:DUF1564 family protein n=1 Tax=Leptospira yasudae TaxID=2202201 RepID=A0A6N4QUT8_9LEPT|nr:DUF1564 family protein [Leptospira yasudae]TGL76090.1 DUF1564 family protein [Leptospira yasudae]TGL83556.1 DUF1564 family protein [Leptospira yasudae]TGL85460.1 DUF1564 family protein [Leptospira yasudae]